MQTQQAPLTKLQSKTFKFVKSYIAKHKKGPTFKEVSEHLGGGNEMQGHSHLKALQKKGLITWTPNTANSLQILKDIEEAPKANAIKPLAKTQANGHSHLNGHVNGHVNGIHTNGAAMHNGNGKDHGPSIDEILASGADRDNILVQLAVKEKAAQDKVEAAEKELAEIQITRKVIHSLPAPIKPADVSPSSNSAEPN